MEGESAIAEALLYLKGFTVYSNTDLTEGKGALLPIAWTTVKSTAERLATGKGVQGSKATVTETGFYRINGVIYGPILLTYPSKEDTAKDNRDSAIQKALDKAKDLGLSEEDIEILRNSGSK